MNASGAAHARIEAFGIVLRRMGPADLEQVRQWRNSPEVSRYMAFRDEITPEMQQRWFAGLDPQRQFFYVIELQGRGVGVANLKDLDTLARSAEGGVYLSDPSLRDGLVGLAAVLALYDYGFEALGLQSISAHILADNRRAIRFNQALGFRREPDQDDVQNQLYRVSRADYANATSRLRAFFATG